MAYEDNVPPVWVDVLKALAVCVGAALLVGLALYVVTGWRPEDTWEYGPPLVIPRPEPSADLYVEEK